MMMMMVCYLIENENEGYKKGKNGNRIINCGGVLHTYNSS